MSNRLQKLTARTKAILRSPKFRNRVGVSAVILFAAMVAFPIATYAYFARDIADPARLMNHNNTGITLTDRSGEVFYTFGRTGSSENIGLDKISDHMERALIASEDKNFYKHSGYSIKNMGGALYGNILNRDATKYGGSTLTQQLVKNTLLSSDKNYLRKYQELSLAIAAERHYSKDEILQMYLNSVYYGEGAFGISAAAKTYFNKTPDQLTLAESSMLVGLLPAPSAYSPISGDASLGKKQQLRVLSSMADAGYIQEADIQTAVAEQPVIAEPTVQNTNTHAQHFAQMVLEDLASKYGEENLARSGMYVQTSLDLSIQKHAEAQVSRRVAQLKAQGGSNAGMVAIDPKTGHIMALVGSVDWDNTEFGKVNMATAARQPGSSFKPIIFAEAFDKKLLTPATILKDTRRSFGSYTPVNHDFKYMGDISARRSLALSRNLTAIEVIEKLGVNNATTAAQRMGITTVDDPDRYGLALALGVAETRLLDMTNAYAAFANNGQQFQPVKVISVRNKFDKEIYRPRPNAKKVQSAEASFLVNSILSDAEARAPTFNSLTISGRPVAVKTGTTDNNHDAWTIGYTPSIAIGVWVGNNQNVAMSGVAGGAGAGPIWRSTIEKALAGTPVEQFAQTNKIEKVLICSGTTNRALRPGDNTTYEYFIKGTGATGVCNNEPIQEPTDNPNRGRDNEENTNNPSGGSSGSGDGNGDGSPDDTDQGGNETDPPTNDEDTTVTPPIIE